jgi:hypothetical protein
MKRFTPPGTDQSPAQLLQTGSRNVHSGIQEVLINCIWNMEECPQ